MSEAIGSNIDGNADGFFVGCEDAAFVDHTYCLHFS